MDKGLNKKLFVYDCIAHCSYTRYQGARNLETKKSLGKHFRIWMESVPQLAVLPFHQPKQSLCNLRSGPKISAGRQVSPNCLQV